LWHFSCPLYFSSFIEGYKNFRAKPPNSKPVNLYFAPGLEYRILFIKTALGLQLMLARENERLKIFWTEIIAE